jgi:hypothetical protein
MTYSTNSKLIKNLIFSPRLSIARTQVPFEIIQLKLVGMQSMNYWRTETFASYQGYPQITYKI